MPPSTVHQRPARVLAVADTLAAELYELERHLDEALIRGAAITQTLCGGRMDAGLSATVGQSIFDDMARVMPAIIAARRETVAMHHRMDRQAKRMGVVPTLGPQEKTDDGTVETPWPKPTGMLTDA